jgi:hypothetical protein
LNFLKFLAIRCHHGRMATRFEIRRSTWAAGYERLAARPVGDVVGVVVHRIEVSQEDPTYGDGPAEIARFFREHPIGVAATGGAMPYPVIIEPDGQVTQTLPLGRVSPHAVSHNPTTVGVALVGDFRGRPPTEAQLTALDGVCVALLRHLGCGASALHGHDELTGGSRDPNKECPGRMLPMDALRARVAALLEVELEVPPFAWNDDG